MLCLLFVLVLAVADGHNEKSIQNEGALQSGLMPQELNSEFVADREGPWKALMPRVRRDVSESATTMDRVRSYSRIAACVVLAVTAAIEIIMYLVELYNSN
ncbi:uncharacterized protein LOC121738102 [Aricia agestis]|uniref:uncharacterized protein LOC121738102 n=1 Tax=Aricia agestis TaxID=91739 RepID=UPI001C202FAF|nr:uncharacterized protein LOC121738102 [Aricia agestis]